MRAELNAGAPPEAEPRVSVEDAARRLGVAKDSLYRWIERRALLGHKVGHLWKFNLSAVDEWTRAGGAKGTDAKGARFELHESDCLPCKFEKAAIRALCRRPREGRQPLRSMDPSRECSTDAGDLRGGA